MARNRLKFQNNIIQRLIALNSFDSNERLRELSDLIFKLTSKNTTEQKQILTKEIRKAEEAGDERKVNELLGEFNNLLKKD